MYHSFFKISRNIDSHYRQARIERYMEFLKHQLCKKVRKIMCHMCFRMDWASKFETSLSSRVCLKEDLR